MYNADNKKTKYNKNNKGSQATSFHLKEKRIGDKNSEWQEVLEMQDPRNNISTEFVMSYHGPFFKMDKLNNFDQWQLSSSTRPLGLSVY